MGWEAPWLMASTIYAGVANPKIAQINVCVEPRHRFDTCLVCCYNSYTV